MLDISYTCNGAVKRGVPGGRHLYWRVRVFWSSSLVYRPSDKLHVCTIPLSGCMDRRSCYIPFYYQVWLAWYSKTCTLAASPEELSPCSIPCRVSPGPWTFSDDWAAWGAPQTKIVSSKNWEDYNLCAHSTLVNRFQNTQQLWSTVRAGFLNSPGDLCWLDSPIWAIAFL